MRKHTVTISFEVDESLEIAKIENQVADILSTTKLYMGIMGIAVENEQYTHTNSDNGLTLITDSHIPDEETEECQCDIKDLATWGCKCGAWS